MERKTGQRKEEVKQGTTNLHDAALQTESRSLLSIPVSLTANGAPLLASVTTNSRGCFHEIVPWLTSYAAMQDPVLFFNV
jgi:hypothetical protein